MDDLILIMVCVAPLAIRWATAAGRDFDAARYAAFGLGVAFLYFSLGHFVVTDQLVQMLPGWVPQRRLVIYTTGLLEALTAVSLFTKQWRRIGGIAAAVMLVLFLPANIYAAVHHVGVGEHQSGPGYLWIRIPMQVFFVAWALWPVWRRRSDA
ncbi:hypothetical protein [Pseudoxanthomonas sp.]|uniref:DoxX family protein n=1 Tax=Pseudoxanthomonas sp. TaxID=1871049 RepID=UPI0026370043|nr:hypothetical protein [Pseudoxanthomonas sp.]WDS35247.1 MAG: hypothetical protein O8I58_12880 [Pseudoxanthomonas sp.]